jgi:hypothetical protein
MPSPRVYLSGCNASELALIEQYRRSYKKTLNNFIEVNQELSVWSIACSNHVYAFEDAFYDNPHERIPAQTGKSVRDMVEEFVLRGTKEQEIRCVHYGFDGYRSQSNLS